MLTDQELAHARWHARKPVAMGLHFGVAVLADGSLAHWGYAGDGGGDGDGDGTSTRPPHCLRQTDTDRPEDPHPPRPQSERWRAVAVAAGYTHAAALLDDGAVVWWGGGPARAGGGGDQNVPAPPAPGVPARLRGQPATAIAAGCDWTVAALADGSLAAFGDGAYGRTAVPVINTADPGAHVLAVAAGFGHGLALQRSGRALAWGLGGGGDDATVPAAAREAFCFNQAVVPMRPEGDPSALRAVAIAAGGYHSVILWNDGAVTCWGRGVEGQCAPGVVLRGRRVVAVAASLVTTAAVDTEGVLLVWGKGGAEGDDATPLPGWWARVPDIGTPGRASMGSCGAPDVPRPMVLAVALGNLASAAVIDGGVLIAWGDDLDGRAQPPGALEMQGLTIPAAPLP